jgi:hypothetical protein
MRKLISAFNVSAFQLFSFSAFQLFPFDELASRKTPSRETPSLEAPPREPPAGRWRWEEARVLPGAAVGRNSFLLHSPAALAAVPEKFCAAGA